MKTNRASYNSETRELTELYGFQWFDSLELFCAEPLCMSYQDGKMLYFDKTHLTPFGSAKLLQTLFQRGIL